MKKRHLYITGIVVILLVLGIMAVTQIEIAPFRFLHGHKLNVQFIEEDYNSKAHYDMYSFPEDFDALCTAVSTELANLGFQEDLRRRIPGQKKVYTKGITKVGVIDRTKAIEQIRTNNSNLDDFLVPASDCITVIYYYVNPKIGVNVLEQVREKLEEFSDKLGN